MFYISHYEKTQGFCAPSLNPWLLGSFGFTGVQIHPIEVEDAMLEGELLRRKAIEASGKWVNHLLFIRYWDVPPWSHQVWRWLEKFPPWMKRYCIWESPILNTMGVDSSNRHVSWTQGCSGVSFSICVWFFYIFSCGCTVTCQCYFLLFEWITIKHLIVR